MDPEKTQANPYFHDDSLDETVTLNLENPAGTDSMVLTFGYFDADNNWFWAIDNLVIAGEILADANGDTYVDDKDASILGGALDARRGGRLGRRRLQLGRRRERQGRGDPGGQLDRVRGENSVPEPATWVLILFGLAALAVRRRFR